MTDGKYAFSHILVAGSTLWCIYNTNKFGGWKWIYGTYGTLCFYSFIGVWRYGNPKYGKDAQKIYDFSYKCLQSFALSCTMTALYLYYGHDVEYALIHVVLPCVPILLYILKDEWLEELVDGIILSNVISCLFLAFSDDNYYAMALGVNSLICHFFLRKHSYSDVPAKILYNTALCFNAFFAHKALNQAIFII